MLLVAYVDVGGIFEAAIIRFALSAGERDVAISGGKQRVIIAAFDVLPRVIPGSALAYKNAAGAGKLSCKAFNSESFAL